MKTQSAVSHISHLFDDEIQTIKDQLVRMGGMIELQLNTITEGIQKNQIETLATVSLRDKEINDLEVELDRQCTEILALRQPRAADLRYVIAVSRLAGDLEYAGDRLDEVAKILLRSMESDQADAMAQDVRHIFEMIEKMLKGALDSFVRLSIDEALQVCRRDKELESEYKNAVRLLMSSILETPATAGRAINQLWILNELYRFGETMRDIAGYVIFVVLGNDVRHMSYKRLEQLIQQSDSQ